MNIYKVKVLLDVIAEDEQKAMDKASEDINENLTEIDKISVISSEIYS